MNIVKRCHRIGYNMEEYFDIVRNSALVRDKDSLEKVFEIKTPETLIKVLEDVRKKMTEQYTFDTYKMRYDILTIVISKLKIKLRKNRIDKIINYVNK